jgi:guanylate kinase
MELGIYDGLKVYNNGLDATYIALIPPGMDALRERLQQTSMEKTAGINKILEIERKELLEIEKSSSIFTNKIINDVLEDSYTNFKNAVVSSFPHLNMNYNDLINLAKTKYENPEYKIQDNFKESEDKIQN